ncbi:DUF1768-domain-containing protein [Hypoxylon argillaceum]|nr:DUF1768-domain-containing protein [Hypoxylon argillaceum]
MPPERSGIAKRTSKPSSSSSSKKSTPSTSPAAAPPPDPHTGPIFFWRPQEVATGYLSQWYAHPFRDRADPSKVYATAEHFMMHQKALLFGDAAAAASILEAASPRDVKALGRAVRGFEQAVWERARARIVAEGNWAKFSLPVVVDDDDGTAAAAGAAEAGGKKGGEGVEEARTWKLGNADDALTVRAKSFRDVLLATGDRELVEASPRDRIWGIGFGAKGAEAKRAKWGMNLLGKCLMEVREQFRNEAEAEAQDKEGARVEDSEEA